MNSARLLTVDGSKTPDVGALVGFAVPLLVATALRFATVGLCYLHFPTHTLIDFFLLCLL
jgi:hypothetical protein